MLRHHRSTPALFLRHQAITIVLLVSFSALQAHAQVALQRTVIDVAEFPPNPNFPDDPPHPGVDMLAGPHRVRFDSWYGGMVRYWHLYGAPNGYQTSIIWPNAGAAMQLIYDTGQDPTQGTPNGSTPNPIAILGDLASNLRYNYYVRETVFQPPSPSDPRAIYEVTGFAPFWWVSNVDESDAIPNGNNSGWCTGHTNCGWVFEAGWPIQFRATESNRTGILMRAHQYKSSSTFTWNRRLHEIDGGRVAFKISVNLESGSPNSFAGVMFRRHVPDQPNATLTTAEASPGYMLAINRLGIVQLLRYAQGGGPVIVRDFGAVAPQVAVGPVQLEVRTHNFEDFRGMLQVFIDDSELRPAAPYVDPQPILGPHFGLFAFTEPGTEIEFSHRAVYDVGIEFVSRYTAFPAGYIESDITVRNAPFVEEPHRFYGQGMPGPQLNPYYQAEPLNTVGIQDICGDYVDTFVNIELCSEDCSVPAPNPVTGDQDALLIACALRGAGSGYAGWVGSPSRTHGLYLIPRFAWIDEQPAQHPILSVLNLEFQFGGGRIPIAGMSPLEFRQPLFLCEPHTVNSFRAVARWTLDPEPFGTTPVITNQPDTQVVCEGETIIFVVGASAEPPPTFAWLRNGGVLTDDGRVTGTATNALTITSTQSTDAGEYSVIVDNGCGTVESTPAMLSVVTDSMCSDGVFCNGPESCSSGGTCLGATFPCGVSQWCNEESTICVPHGDGDFDQDTDRDLRDWGRFQACFGDVLLVECYPANLVGMDGTITLDDAAAMIAGITGPLVP